jgi:NAD+ synthase (glutamine-hydrolysing)
MRIALLQLNPTICDLGSNAQKVVLAAGKAFEKGADICVTPELAIMGYPPKDLFLIPEVIDKCLDAVRWVAAETADAGPVLVGTPFWRGEDKKVLHNGACLLSKGEIVRFFGKTLLPNYDVFDEQRYFFSYRGPGYFDFHGKRIGVTICEDIWNNMDLRQKKKYGSDPVRTLSEQKADLIVNMSASPFSLGKQNIRRSMLCSMAGKYGIPFLFCNQVGGNDDLVFDGRSMAVDEKGKVLSAGKEFEEDCVLADLNNPDKNDVRVHDYSPESETWNAMVLGVRDYVRKSGFSRALLGLSGGIDSALVAAVAARALGPENVTGVLMPSPYSSRGSIDDSLELAKNLGIRTLKISIDKLMHAYDSALAPVFAGMSRDVTEENIQSRIRGNLLMAISNKLGGLVLATGNKSELAVGYCTIYGDMSGGLAPLSDVPKTLVYAVARRLNRKKKIIIPEGIINKAPSAELRPDQKDRDSLPDYEILDQILQMHIQHHVQEEEIIARGFDPKVVYSVTDMVRKAEFKRRQSPPGLKITDLAFGTGWRMPLAARCSCVTKK